MAAYRILVLDKDSAAASVTRLGLLRVLGDQTNVTITDTPAQAQQEYQQQPYDLLIIDPAPINGQAIALLQQLLSGATNIGVLVLTSRDTPRLRRSMSGIGVQHYLAKPVDVPTLADEALAALQGRQQQRA